MAEPAQKQRMVWELHSFSRGPPIALDDDIADVLYKEGYITPDHDGTRKFYLTDKGAKFMREAADMCKIDHCPCHK